jgi:hypothetical protein
MDDRKQTRRPAWQRQICLVLGAIGLAVALSGCIVVPERGGYWHPYHYGYY